MNTYKAEPGDVSFVFGKDGNIVLSSNTEGETNLQSEIEQIKRINMEHMLSGYENRIRTSEICAMTLAMIMNPAIYDYVMARFGEMNDAPAGPALH